jgi:hypothetical protein
VFFYRILPALIVLCAASSGAGANELERLSKLGAACARLTVTLLEMPPGDEADYARLIGWVAQCNGNFMACRQSRETIKERRKASPLRCEGDPIAMEEAEADFDKYLKATTGLLPKCIRTTC